MARVGLRKHGGTAEAMCLEPDFVLKRGKVGMQWVRDVQLGDAAFLYIEVRTPAGLQRPNADQEVPLVAVGLSQRLQRIFGGFRGLQRAA